MDKNVSPLLEDNKYGWKWETTRDRFNKRVRGLKHANNTPGPSNSYYQMIKFKQELLDEKQFKQELLDEKEYDFGQRIVYMFVTLARLRDRVT